MTTICNLRLNSDAKAFRLLDRIAASLSIYLGALFLGYCLVFFWVCPQQQLWCAIIFEIVIFVISSSWIVKSLAATSTVHRMRWRWLSKSMNLLTWGCIIILSCISLYGSIDFIAMTSAAWSNTSLATTVYCILPGSELIGLHPAYSLECLAGAFVERRDIKKAEQLYHSLLAVRQWKYGSSSDLVAALYTDLGELGTKQHDLVKAEKWYVKAVELAPSSGRALTGLANVMRDTERFAEAKLHYLRALNSRLTLFGKNSNQYQETWFNYKKLMEQHRFAKQGK
jgi:hypothetical protein